MKLVFEQCGKGSMGAVSVSFALIGGGGNQRGTVLGRRVSERDSVREEGIRQC